MPSDRLLLVKVLRMTAKYLHMLAVCGLTDNLPTDDEQRRVHYISVRALQEAAGVLDVAAAKIATEERR